MKEIEVKTLIKAKEEGELSPIEKKLVDASRRATAGAYAPYSNFKVGAAILLDNGEIVCGANQENVAYPSGTCAERSACFWAAANYPQAHFEMIAVCAIGTDGLICEYPTAPCGACRQALLEYEVLASHDVPVLLVGRDVVYCLPSVKSLLPLAFTEF